jgi:DNA-binding transcriptional regulator PaaX
MTADGLSWHILAYRLPGESARQRTAVWRQLKAAGAVHLASSVAALPASPAADQLLRRLRTHIIDAGGSAQVLLADVVAGQAEIIRQYSTARAGGRPGPQSGARTAGPR